MSLLLAIDVGNTNMVLGLYQGKTLQKSFRLHTDRIRTVDEYGVFLKSLLNTYDYRLRDVVGVGISNVVPILQEKLEQVCQTFLKQDAFFVRPDMPLPFEIDIPNPSEVGADLIAGCCGALSYYDPPFIAADLGTATTLTVIDKDSKLLGASIAPGLEISLKAIRQQAPHLPAFRLEPSPKPYGTDTITALQSGLIQGHACLVEGLVNKIKAEIGPCKVVATGGLAGVIEKATPCIDKVVDTLVLEGIVRLHSLQGS